ncbi:MAG: transcription antitermination factor NusB [Clostridiales bacterium]|nr:transcription antitermination factor NusB [Clostridiales bacterium]
MSRIETREAVVFCVYQTDFRLEEKEDQIKIYLSNNPELDEDRDFFITTALGVLDNRKELDLKIESFLNNWKIDRLPKIDKAILEVAFYEILYNDDVPVSVSINEAVKLAKKYGTDDSSSYINGVLSSFEKSL